MARRWLGKRDQRNTVELLILQGCGRRRQRDNGLSGAGETARHVMTLADCDGGRAIGAVIGNSSVPFDQKRVRSLWDLYPRRVGCHPYLCEQSRATC